MNEPKVEIQQCHYPQVATFQNRQLLAQGRFGRGQVVHEEPCRQGKDHQERYPNPGGILQKQH